MSSSPYTGPPQPLGYSNCFIMFKTIIHLLNLDWLLKYLSYFILMMVKFRINIQFHINQHLAMGETDIVNKSYGVELIVLIAGQMIAMFYSYYFIFMGLCIRLILIVLVVIQRKRQVKIEELQNKLVNYPWANHHRIIKNCLQFMKCMRMIEQGYDSKSNTNIILQQEKQSKYKEITTKNQDLSNIDKSILEIVDLLIKIQKHINILFEQNSYDTQEERINEIILFRDIFKTSKKIDYIFEKINKSIGEFQRLKTVKNSIKIRKQERNRENYATIAKDLDKYEKLLLHLSLFSLSQFLKLQLNQQFNIFLPILATKSNQTNNLQPLIKFVNECQQIIAENKKDQQTPITQLHPQKLEEHPPQRIHQRQEDQSNLNQKKQFMKKLDSLLMIGLAKKRQQQFQQKMKLLQLQQPSNLHQ